MHVEANLYLVVTYWAAHYGQRCCQIEISPEFGSFSGAFLNAFDKYVEILCHFWELFQRFGSIRKLFRAFLSNFENGTEILRYFLCYFVKTPEFGRSPEIWEPATPLPWAG